MVRRYKVTKISDGSGKIEVTINPTQDLEVKQVFVTLPDRITNAIRDVYLTRKDGTVLGIEKAEYCTSQPIGIIFPNPFIVPSYDPQLIVHTRTMSVSDEITIDVFYDEVDLY